MTIARLAGPASVVAAAALAASCGAPEGTIELSIATAPESDVMDSIERVRLTLSDPPAVAEAERGPDGFELDLDVVAKGQRGRITFEGFDESDELVAVGQAGPLPIAAVTLDVAIYVAAPDSFAEAPVTLEPARDGIGAAPLIYGALLAGGRDADGSILDDALIYNVHSHAFQVGEPLPSPRAAPAVVARQPAGPVYLFGGRDEIDRATQTAWSFDASVPPAGRYSTLDVDPDLARAGAAAASLGDDAFFITGDPPVEIDPLAARAFALLDAPPLGGTATSTQAGGEPIVLATGDDPSEAIAARWRRTGLDPIAAPDALAREGHGAAALPNGDVLIAGGSAGGAALASALRYRPDEDGFEVIDDFLATPRTNAAVVRARERLVVIGGTGDDGLALGDAEIFNADTLAPLGAVPLVAARTRPTAVPLENGQILVAGGTGDDGDPVAPLELFTPGI